MALASPKLRTINLRRNADKNDSPGELMKMIAGVRQCHHFHHRQGDGVSDVRTSAGQTPHLFMPSQYLLAAESHTPRCPVTCAPFEQRSKAGGRTDSANLLPAPPHIPALRVGTSKAVAVASPKTSTAPLNLDVKHLCHLGAIDKDVMSCAVPGHTQNSQTNGLGRSAAAL